MAIEQGQESFVKTLLSAGARADLHNELTGDSLIHIAVKTGSLFMTKTLLEFLTEKPKINKANLNVFDNNGQHVLHLAAAKGHIEMLRYLLERPDLKNVDPKDLLGKRFLQK